MSTENVILAIDTSNYTTSVAILDENGGIVANIKKLLSVKAGERGLRQSDAVFSHTVNIPELMKAAAPCLKDKRILAVGVSERPRNQEGSYMPCFLVGVSVAEGIAASLGVPLYRFSHQCGHIMAAVLSSGREELLNSPFAAFHVSGGTTELVRVTDKGDSFDAELLGGTADLNAGQIIDRIGVYMGLGFPSGAEMERLALRNIGKIPNKKLSVVGLNANLSGLENLAKKLYDDTNDKLLTSAFVFDYLGRALIALSKAYEEQYGKTSFVYAGGVMSNSIIKRMLSEEFTAYFAEPVLSSDNAVGTAALALRAYKKENKV